MSWQQYSTAVCPLCAVFVVMPMWLCNIVDAVNFSCCDHGYDNALHSSSELVCVRWWVVCKTC